MNWTDRPLLAFDTETTGTDVFNDRIVTATAAWLAPDAEPRIREWLINPGIDIPEEATAVHGITTDHARTHGTDPTQAIDEIAGILIHALSRGVPVVAMNATFDLTILEAETRRHGLAPLTGRGGPIAPVIDPLVIDRALDRYRRGKRTLTALTDHYGITLGNAHDATADAIAAGNLTIALADRYPADVRDVLLEDLHTAQIEWHAAWATNFQDYLRRTKPDAVIDTAWPLRAPRTSNRAA